MYKMNNFWTFNAVLRDCRYFRYISLGKYGKYGHNSEICYLFSACILENINLKGDVS